MQVLVYAAQGFPREPLEHALGRLRRKHPELRIVSAFRLGAEQLVGLWGITVGVPIEFRAVDTVPRGDAAVSFNDPDNAARARAAGLPVWEIRS